MVELGVDPFVKDFGDVTDADYLRKNMGPGKRFPGGPSCFVGGKEVPCMCAWSENGSMTSEILTTIVKTLDILQVLDRSSGINPFILLDGHGSRLGLPFLRYINSTGNIWFACIGVPYGTSLKM